MSVPTPTQTEQYDPITLWALDFDPEMACEANHATDGNRVCTQTPTHMFGHSCTGASYPICQACADYGFSRRGAVCAETHTAIIVCWQIIPIGAQP